MTTDHSQPMVDEERLTTLFGSLKDAEDNWRKQENARLTAAVDFTPGSQTVSFPRETHGPIMIPEVEPDVYCGITNGSGKFLPERPHRISDFFEGLVEFARNTGKLVLGKVGGS